MLEGKAEQRLTRLNDLLVTLFFQILQLEERSLSEIMGKITPREIHVLEAVDYLSQLGNNKMMEIARLLGISPGSLTTAVNVLVAKGYLHRSTDRIDRRSILLFLTEEGEKANRVHLGFHQELKHLMDQHFAPEQVECIVSVLRQIENFFIMEEKRMA